MKPVELVNPVYGLRRICEGQNVKHRQDTRQWQEDQLDKTIDGCTECTSLSGVSRAIDQNQADPQ